MSFKFMVNSNFSSLHECFPLGHVLWVTAKFSSQSWSLDWLYGVLFSAPSWWSINKYWRNDRAGSETVCLCARIGVIAVCERDRKHPQLLRAPRMCKTPPPPLPIWKVGSGGEYGIEARSVRISQQASCWRQERRCGPFLGGEGSEENRKRWQKL
jgi:hypothetical protein